MKRILAIALLALGACGGSDVGTSGTSVTTAGVAVQDWVPAGATEVEPGIWAHNGMLYGTDCDRMNALTIEGAPYGPTGSWDDGTAKAGHGSLCIDN